MARRDLFSQLLSLGQQDNKGVMDSMFFSPPPPLDVIREMRVDSKSDSTTTTTRNESKMRFSAFVITHTERSFLKCQVQCEEQFNCHYLRLRIEGEDNGASSLTRVQRIIKK